MKIGDIKLNKSQIITTLLLLIGLLVTVTLVQRQQIFKSKASSDINSAISVTDPAGNELEYVGNNTYNTNSLDVKIGIKDLEQLK